MRLGLLGGIHCHPHNEKKRCAAEVKRDIKIRYKQRRQDTDSRQIYPSPEGNPRKDPVYIFRGGGPRPYAGDKTAEFFQVIRNILGVKLDSRVKIRKKHNKPDIEDVIYHPARGRLFDIDCKNGIFMKLTMVAGNIIMDDANIGGITPAVLSLRGRCWEPPPMTFLPTTLFGSCPGF